MLGGILAYLIGRQFGWKSFLVAVPFISGEFWVNTFCVTFGLTVVDANNLIDANRKTSEPSGNTM